MLYRKNDYENIYKYIGFLGWNAFIHLDVFISKV
jgi:hypothetical protein